MSKRKNFTPEQKLAIVRRHLLEKVPVSDLCDEMRNAVKFQILPKYRASLGTNLDSSTREQQSEDWWASQWADSTFRMKRCPGKRVLAEVRRWCQAEIGLTLTSGELIRSIPDCPEEVARVAKDIEQHFYET